MSAPDLHPDVARAVAFVAALRSDAQFALWKSPKSGLWHYAAYTEAGEIERHGKDFMSAVLKGREPNTEKAE